MHFFSVPTIPKRRKVFVKIFQCDLMVLFFSQQQAKSAHSDFSHNLFLHFEYLAMLFCFPTTTTLLSLEAFVLKLSRVYLSQVELEK